MKKRFIIWTMLFILIIGVLPTEGFAAETDFIIEDGILVKYTGPNQHDVIIPNNVKIIGTYAFSDYNIKSVILHEGVKEIQSYAFAFSGIEKISIVDGLEVIGDHAFWRTPLKEAVLPQSVKIIGEKAFSDEIVNVTIYNQNAVIEHDAISNVLAADSGRFTGIRTVYGYANSTAQRYVNESNVSSEGEPCYVFKALATQKPVEQTPIVTQETLKASLNKSKVLVNGVEKSFESYTINNNNYFKLRDLANVVSGTEKQFEVTWDGTNNVINLLSNTGYTNVGGEMITKSVTPEQIAKLSTSAIHMNGLEIQLTAYLIGDNNYFKLRDVAKAFDIGITWDQNKIQVL